MLELQFPESPSPCIEIFSWSLGGRSEAAAFNLWRSLCLMQWRPDGEVGTAVPACLHFLPPHFQLFFQTASPAHQHRPQAPHQMLVHAIPGSPLLSHQGSGMCLPSRTPLQAPTLYQQQRFRRRGCWPGCWLYADPPTPSFGSLTSPTVV